MQPDTRRWVEVTPSEFAHERAGLAAVRDLLPDADPYRAWSNFTFTAADGRVSEVDLLVVGRSGLHLVELKHWQGALRGDGQTWWHNGHPVDNLRLLAGAKAKRLRSLLEDVARDKKLRTRVPYVTASVLLHAPDTVVQLDDQGRQGVYGLDGQGPADLPAVVADLLTSPAGDIRNVVDRTRSREIAKLVDAAGIRRSVRLRQVGTLLLDEDPIAEGPGWQDYLGHHTQLDGVVRRLLRQADGRWRLPPVAHAASRAPAASRKEPDRSASRRRCVQRSRVPSLARRRCASVASSHRR